MVFAVVTGGGTSGHVIPAMAVIEALQDAGHGPGELAYVGSVRGVESSMVPATGVACAFLPISGLQRSFSPRSLARNVALPFRLFRSTLAARRLVRQWKPSVVVSVGGYASEPMARAAVSAGVPLVCVSYDFVPGLATRRQARTAAACAVAFEGSSLPRAVVTGAPVRRAARSMDTGRVREAVRARMGLAPGTVLVTVVGGSLGSAALNSAVPHLVESLAARGVQAHVHHVTGPRSVPASTNDSRGTVSITRAAVESDMPGVLAATDIFVSRAGASTIAEIAAIGVASILVPWPGAADNHQESNARWLSDDGAAVLMLESGSLSSDLASAVLDLASDPVRRAALAGQANAKGAHNRGNGLVELVEKAARTH